MLIMEWQLLHITKTGGTSIENWGKLHNFQWGYHHPHMKKRYLSNYEAWHSPPTIMKIYNPKLYDKVYKNRKMFCVVRHPVCRMLSEANCPFHGIKKNGKHSLSEFIRNRLIQLDHQVPHVSHGIPVTPWYNCHIYLRFENIIQDFSKFAKTFLNIQNATLPHDNKKRKNGFTFSDMTKKDINGISRHYKLDIMRFNYSITHIRC